ncbi:unnamed protein product, partial [marine sediment metagenome]
PFIPIIRFSDSALPKWKENFIKKKIPWAVTPHRKCGHCTLWKVDERLTPVEIDAERMKKGVNWFREGSA